MPAAAFAARLSAVGHIAHHAPQQVEGDVDHHGRAPLEHQAPTLAARLGHQPLHHGQQGHIGKGEKKEGVVI